MVPPQPVFTESYYVAGPFWSLRTCALPSVILFSARQCQNSHCEAHAFLLQTLWHLSRVTPPYSPDLNSIDHAWVLLKQQLRTSILTLTTTVGARRRWRVDWRNFLLSVGRIFLQSSLRLYGSNTRPGSSSYERDGILATSGSVGSFGLVLFSLLWEFL